MACPAEYCLLKMVLAVKLPCHIPNIDDSCFFIRRIEAANNSDASCSIKLSEFLDSLHRLLSYW
jgi:hypothetical protein